MVILWISALDLNRCVEVTPCLIEKIHIKEDVTSIVVTVWVFFLIFFTYIYGSFESFEGTILLVVLVVESQTEIVVVRCNRSQ